MELLIRILFTAAVMTAAVLIAHGGNPVAGLIVVPAAAIWLRRRTLDRRV